MRLEKNLLHLGVGVDMNEMLLLVRVVDGRSWNQSETMLT